MSNLTQTSSTAWPAQHFPKPYNVVVVLKNVKIYAANTPVRLQYIPNGQSVVMYAFDLLSRKWKLENTKFSFFFKSTFKLGILVNLLMLKRIVCSLFFL